VTRFQPEPGRASGHLHKHRQEGGSAPVRPGPRPVEPHAHRGVTRPLAVPLYRKPAINSDNATVTGRQDHNTSGGYRHLKSLVLSGHPVAGWISLSSPGTLHSDPSSDVYGEHGPHRPTRDRGPRCVDPPRRDRGTRGGMRSSRPAGQRSGTRDGSRNRHPSESWALRRSAGGRAPSGDDRPQAVPVGPGRPVQRREIGDRVFLECAVRRARPRRYSSHPRQGHHHTARGSKPGRGSRPLPPGRRLPGSPGAPAGAARRRQARRWCGRRATCSHPVGCSERIAPGDVSPRPQARTRNTLTAEVVLFHAASCRFRYSPWGRDARDWTWRSARDRGRRHGRFAGAGQPAGSPGTASGLAGGGEEARRKFGA